MGLFLAQKLADPAVAVWARQRERGLAVDMEEIVALVDALISEDSIGKAQQVWRSGLQASNWALDSVHIRAHALCESNSMVQITSTSGICFNTFLSRRTSAITSQHLFERKA